MAAVGGGFKRLEFAAGAGFSNDPRLPLVVVDVRVPVAMQLCAPVVERSATEQVWNPLRACTVPGGRRWRAAHAGRRRTDCSFDERVRASNLDFRQLWVDVDG